MIVGMGVEVLQRFHALVPRARRRIAVIQDRLQQPLAVRIVPAFEKNHSLSSEPSVRNSRAMTDSSTYMQDV